MSNYYLFFWVRQMIKLKQSKKNWIWMINFLQVREIKQKRDNGDFSLTEYNTRDKIKHTNKLNTESILCSSNICVVCYFQDHFTSKKESGDDDDDGSKPKGTRDQCKTE